MGAQTPIDPEWLRDFEAARRRPLRQRIDYAFVSTPKPVIYDVPYRVFQTMEEYRRWCRQNLPSYLWLTRRTTFR